MKIKEIKNQFTYQHISKPSLIQLLFEKHLVLQDFSESLHDTEISKIVIENNNVYFTTTPHNKKIASSTFKIDFLDQRNVPLEAFNFNHYEKKDAQIIYNLTNDNSTIIDIGANIGWYSIHLANSYPNAKIYAIEALPDTFQHFKLNADLNTKNNNLFLHNIALSNKKTELTFFYDPSQKGASSSENIMNNDTLTKVKVEAIPLDDFISKNNISQLDFVKCDVEGAELLVFQGGINTIKKFKPIIFTEMLRKWSAKFNYHPNDIIKLFNDLNYSCYVTDAQNTLTKILEITENTTETNFVFLDNEKQIY
ncbi:MAG: FkbM family methyltransferase [Alphaproteobacteria bacterium]|nr:FkbM family methyltransferase [Alphaproteobacteria bacterium]